jgi:hypothetical protein
VASHLCCPGLVHGMACLVSPESPQLRKSRREGGLTLKVSFPIDFWWKSGV